MRIVLTLMPLLVALSAHAGTAIEPIQRQPVDVAGQTQAQILQTAEQCLIRHLKNFGATSPQTILGIAVPESKSTSVDPSVILTTTESAIEARHRFETSGVLAQAKVQADLTLEAKDGRYRLRWHDYRYGVAGQKADDAELIKEALPYKKAMAALEQTSADIDACMAQPKPSQDW